MVGGLLGKHGVPWASDKVWQEPSAGCREGASQPREEDAQLSLNWGVGTKKKGVTCGVGGPEER